METGEPLILYTRAGCHLCEQAAAMLERTGIKWRPVDIDADPKLEERYGLRIPVLRRSGSGEELDYPFDDSRIKAYAGMGS
jgi:hypothetical protein